MNHCLDWEKEEGFEPEEPKNWVQIPALICMSGDLTSGPLFVKWAGSSPSKSITYEYFCPYGRKRRETEEPLEESETEE